MNEDSGEIDVLGGQIGAVDVAGSCISVRLLPEVARYAIARASEL